MDKIVLVVDDHPLFRRALVSLVEESRACSEVIAAASAEEGLARVRETNVDLILLDLGLPGAAGVDAISLFRRASDAKIVVVSASEHRQEIAAATRAGASTVVSKSVSMETLRDVVHRALTDSLPEQKWIRPAGSLSLGDDVERGLTVRQQEIATLLMEGHSNKEIGMRLSLAEITVKTHLTAIFRLLGVVNRTQAVVAIRRLGIDYGAGRSTTSPGVSAH
ncbi:response regulator transcription factor [Caenimonas sp. SL110]|uniref:response regulator n=1 Tax=Caenimonas sp. SL110 TaxID=1450524 RepID=UPI000652F81F|nr:response regulator transcription factor [Caenimonas sp. SL110]